MLSFGLGGTLALLAAGVEVVALAGYLLAYLAFLKKAGEVARRSHVIVAIEPLRRQESNILNTGAEALEMVRRVQHLNIRMIIDYFHLREENEDPRIIEIGRREIVHLHFANPHGRLWPHDLVEDDHYGAFFGYLKKTGYSGGISIEGQGSFGRLWFDGNGNRAVRNCLRSA